MTPHILHHIQYRPYITEINLHIFHCVHDITGQTFTLISPIVSPTHHFMLPKLLTANNVSNFNQKCVRIYVPLWMWSWEYSVFHIHINLYTRLDLTSTRLLLMPLPYTLTALDTSHSQPCTEEYWRDLLGSSGHMLACLPVDITSDFCCWWTLMRLTDALW